LNLPFEFTSVILVSFSLFYLDKQAAPSVVPLAYPGGCLNLRVGVPFVSVAYLDVIICGIHLIIMTIIGK